MHCIKHALENGNYKVTLGFVESHHNQNDMRSFDVAIQGTQVLDDFDIPKEAGGKNIALKRVFPIKITDRTLNIDLTTEQDASRISFIKVARLSDNLPDSSIRINAGTFLNDTNTNGAYFMADEQFLVSSASHGRPDASITRNDHTLQGIQTVTPSDKTISSQIAGVKTTGMIACKVDKCQRGFNLITH